MNLNDNRNSTNLKHEQCYTLLTLSIKKKLYIFKFLKLT